MRQSAPVLRRFRMRQLMMDDLDMRREEGFAICERPDGSLTHGPVAVGTSTSVDIPLVCPVKTRIIGTHHTHPDVGGGTGYIDPSPQDWRMSRRFGLKHLCVTVPQRGETRCWDV